MLHYPLSHPDVSYVTSSIRSLFEPTLHRPTCMPNRVRCPLNSIYNVDLWIYVRLLYIFKAWTQDSTQSISAVQGLSFNVRFAWTLALQMSGLVSNFLYLLLRNQCGGLQHGVQVGCCFRYALGLFLLLDVYSICLQ